MAGERESDGSRWTAGRASVGPEVRVGVGTEGHTGTLGVWWESVDLGSLEGSGLGALGRRRTRGRTHGREDCGVGGRDGGPETGLQGVCVGCPGKEVPRGTGSEQTLLSLVGSFPGRRGEGSDGARYRRPRESRGPTPGVPGTVHWPPDLVRPVLPPGLSPNNRVFSGLVPPYPPGGVARTEEGGTCPSPLTPGWSQPSCTHVRRC